MDKTSQKNETRREIRNLGRKLRSAEDELSHTKDRLETWLINDKINDLKHRLGWLYLDCGWYRKGGLYYVNKDN